MELLEAEPPGALERFTAAAMQRRGVRAAGTLVAALLVVVGLSVGLAGEESPAAAQAEPAKTWQRDTSTYEPPPWVRSDEVGWQVLGRPKVNLRSPVYVVEIKAANRTSEARTPQSLRAVGRFVGYPGYRFSAGCTGFDHDETGELRPLRSVVQPGERFLLRCTDTMEYTGNRPRLSPQSIRVQGIPRDGASRGSGSA